MNSKYLVIESDSLQNAKQRLHELISSLGFSEYNYQYIIGEKNIGYANGQIIRNNIILTESENGYHIFEFDCNIVESFGSVIEPIISQYEDLHWCDNVEVQSFIPELPIWLQ